MKKKSFGGAKLSTSKFGPMDCVVAVGHGGQVVRDDRLSMEDQHYAVFVVVNAGGQMVVWKDKYFPADGISITAEELERRVTYHVMKALGKQMN